MSRQHPIEIFMPPNILKAKVGGTVAAVDMAAIKRAEAAMQSLKTEFADWLKQDVQRLGNCRDAYAAEPTDANRDELFRCAHDLKGQAQTFDFPLISRVASSLSRLLDPLNACREIPLDLVDAHVAAVRALFRDKIQSVDDKISVLLADELDARVSKALA